MHETASDWILSTTTPAPPLRNGVTSLSSSKYVCILFALLMLTVSVLSAGCTSNLRTMPPVMDESALITGLRATGSSVNEQEQISQPFFSVTGRTVVVDGASISVFEYATPAAMEKESEYVSPDGFVFTTSTMVTNVDWIGPPHFYKAGRIIVIYIGKDKATIGLLEKVLGKQFAGQP